LSEAPNAVAAWESQGCAVCRRQWETAERPVFVAGNVADHSELYRCAVCGTLWLMTERAAVAVRPEEIRSTYPAVSGSVQGRTVSDPAPTRSTPRVSHDGAQYWRHSVASTDRYFKLLKGQDYILEGDHWAPYDRYKSGPSWWRLTGEPGTDIIDATDLPPDAPM